MKIVVPMLYPKYFLQKKPPLPRRLNRWLSACTPDGTWTRTSLRTQDFKSCVSTSSTTRASELERKTGFEPATPTLARLCSTSWAIFASVRMKGLEPPRLSAPDPKSGVATNYTTSASNKELYSFFVSANIDTFF